MIDQMEQYNRETSQIHAPADLIRRTKEAVREEEQRLESARSQQTQQNATAKSKHSYGKVYKWALPVAAAAVCLILLNASGIMFGRSMSKSQLKLAADTASGAAPASDSDMGAQSETADWAESAAAAADESMDEVNNSFDMAEAETVPTEDYAEDRSEDAVPMEDAASSGAAYENGIEESYKSIQERGLWIEEVEEVPSAYFYSNIDTEGIIIDGIVLYVAKDLDDTWIAYVEIDGQKYAVRGELTEEDISREEFAQAAYEIVERIDLAE